MIKSRWPGKKIFPLPWHAKLANSQGFFKSERDSKQQRFASIPKEFAPGLELIYQKNMPFYEKLKAIKLKAEKEK